MSAKRERQAGASSWESLHFRGKNVPKSKKAPAIPSLPQGPGSHALAGRSAKSEASDGWGSVEGAEAKMA